MKKVTYLYLYIFYILYFIFYILYFIFYNKNNQISFPNVCLNDVIYSIDISSLLLLLLVVFCLYLLKFAYVYDFEYLLSSYYLI
jgi:hypothetical protein